MFQSVVEISKNLSLKTPDRVIFTFVDDSGKVVSTLTCKEVYTRAQQISDSLVNSHHLKKGDRVLLVYPQGLEFVEAFLACLLAGLIPVPVPAPMPLRPDIGLLGYIAIANDCKASAQLTSQSYSRTRSFGRILLALKNGPKWPDLPWIVTDEINSKQLFEPNFPKPEELAFLQYTSGSTRAPRGVCLSYENIFEQTKLLKKELQLGRPESTAVFWMPHYHDFALIGGVINALCGIHHYVSFSTTGFLRRPSLWGELLHRFRATHMGAPDFGYRLFTIQSTPEQRLSWDFTPMVTAICAAEPIRSKTVNDFISAFETSKLNPEAFCPSYGLAEHTVAVTLHGKKRFVIDGKTIFGCGTPGEGVQVKIVDPISNLEVNEGEMGEIWVDSLSRSRSYFGRVEESIEKFQGKLIDSDRSWLRTGDLGAIMDGEIVVHGRLDDMITFRGRNIFPQDAEGLISDADPRVRPGRVLAFAIPISDDGESYQENELGIVIELKDGFENETAISEVAQISRIMLQQEMGIPRAVLIFVPQGTIPKTSSGKLQRTKCKTDWFSDKLKTIKVDRGLE